MEVVLHRIAEYSDDIAEQIGLLRPDLSAGRGSEPADMSILRQTIEWPSHDQLVAELRGKLVGAASMSLILSSMVAGRKAWLEDFVVSSSPDIRGQGVGHRLFNDGVIEWCKEKQAKSLQFHSHHTREAAHTFYKRQGCKISETSPFVLEIVY